MVCDNSRAEEEAAARAKAEKQCRDLSTQVSELQDDLDSEKDAKSKVEKMRKQLNDVSCDCGFELGVASIIKISFVPSCPCAGPRKSHLLTLVHFLGPSGILLQTCFLCSFMHPLKGVLLYKND